MLPLEQQGRGRVVHVERPRASSAQRPGKRANKQGSHGVPVFKLDLLDVKYLVKYQFHHQVIETNLALLVTLPFCYLG